MATETLEVKIPEIEPEEEEFKEASEVFEEKEVVIEQKEVESEGEEEEEEEEEKKGGRKRKRGGGGSSTGEPVTPVSRPSRERKVVERYSAPSSDKVSATKGVEIHKGRGTQLKDIPNVAFKLSKRKSDENLQVLHTILFGKRTKTHSLKRNIHQFSGFVWEENEEKQRAKLREKLDKYVKEKLLDLCDMLDIPVAKSTTKKDELLGKLLEFLESPHATTEVSLADKEQKIKKRKRKTISGSGTASKDKSSGLAKKQKQIPEAKKIKKDSVKAKEKPEEDDEAESADSKLCSDDDDDALKMHKQESDEEEESSEEEDKVKEVKEMQKSSGKKSVKRDSEAKSKTEKGTPTKREKDPKSVKVPAKSTKSPLKSVPNKGAATDGKVSGSNTTSKASIRKKQGEIENKSQTSRPDLSGNKNTKKKQRSKLEGKISGKEEEPSRDEMHAAVSDILKEVDFNTATLSDILRQLEKRFGMTLMHRKSEVKGIIEEVINSMSDEEDDGDEAEEDNGEANNVSEEEAGEDN